MLSLQPNLTIDSEAQLREIIPTPLEGVKRKKVDAFEIYSRRFVENAPFVCVTTRQADGKADIAAYGDVPGFVRVLDDKTLVIFDYQINRIGEISQNLAVNPFVGLIFLIPGINETVRVNGRAAVRRDEAFLASLAVGDLKPVAAIVVELEEIFLHCPKAFVRSKLWDASTFLSQAAFEPEAAVLGVKLSQLEANSRKFIELAPFLCLGTMQSDGAADISPRGDPNGFVQILDDRTLLIPDRPGNRLADNYNNILANPYAALLFLAPGLKATLRVSGKAKLVKDPELLKPMTVQGKEPKLAIWLEIDEACLEQPEAIERARLWDKTAQPDRQTVGTAGEMFFSQLKPRGLPEEVTAETIDASLVQDTKENLY